eukprot:6946031-Prymnesium_polylepis.1
MASRSPPAGTRRRTPASGRACPSRRCPPGSDRPARTTCTWGAKRAGRRAAPAPCARARDRSSGGRRPRARRGSRPPHPSAPGMMLSVAGGCNGRGRTRT